MDYTAGYEHGFTDALQEAQTKTAQSPDEILDMLQQVQAQGWRLLRALTDESDNIYWHMLLTDNPNFEQEWEPYKTREVWTTARAVGLFYSFDDELTPRNAVGDLIWDSTETDGDVSDMTVVSPVEDDPPFNAALVEDVVYDVPEIAAYVATKLQGILSGNPEFGPGIRD